jgi:hypothetical protein
VRFKTGVKISGAPTRRGEKLIFGGGAKPRRQKSIKEKQSDFVHWGCAPPLTVFEPLAIVLS